MSTPLAQYDFLPWLRRGVAAEISNVDPLTGPLPKRAKIEVGVSVLSSRESTSATDVVKAPIELYGPGDVKGIDERHVVRTDPRNATQNFEPNFLAAIEFEEAGFPWAQTPAAATTGTGGVARDRLRPWLVLAVLADDEYQRVEDRPPDSLLVIRVTDGATLPDLDDSWAWAHVQVAGGIGGIDLATLILAQPERVTSRLICPRQLRPRTHYTAFVVPAFDLGVEMGLGRPPSAQTEVRPAWDGLSANVELPVLYRFEFRTTSRGDFESLVRKLQPRRLPKEVGIRPMDVSQPGWSTPSAGTPLGLSGALRSLETTDTTWVGPQRDAFRARLETSLNKGDVVLDGPNDPVVVPPLYGRWHAAVQRVDRNAGGWVNELNLDPRPRSMAGFGTRVVLDQRAQLLAGAWRQVDRILEANRLLKNGQLAREVSNFVHSKHLESAAPDVALTLTRTLHTRLLASPRTVAATVESSRLPTSAASSAFRRTSRPLGPVGRRIGIERAGERSVVSLLNTGELTPYVPPARVAGLEDVADSFFPSWVPLRLRRYLRHAWWLLLLAALLVALLFLLLGLAFGWWPWAAVAAAAGAGILLALAVVAYARRGRWRTAERLSFDDLTPAAFADAPPAPEFRAADPWSGPPTPAVGPVSPETDSDQAARFREASIRLAGTLQARKSEPPVLQPLELDTLGAEIVAKLDPERTVPARLADRIVLEIGPVVFERPPDADPLEPIMAAPEFPQPMYEPLRDLSQDFLLPGLDRVPADTLGLLQENHAFIEAYMVGLNHELARHLLFDRFPTDQRGSYFRQFWDVRGYVPTATDPTDSDELRERLRDIPPVHEWPRAGRLGTNENRVTTVTDNLVLLIRGELLMRYPNAIIYAAEAVLDNGRRALGSRELHPLYVATLPPDVTLLGFDLDRATARGSRDATQPQGWFFVFQQNPGEPHFGLEPAPEPYAVAAVDQWNELGWANFAASANDLDNLVFLPAETPPQNVAIVETADNPGDAQNAWAKDAAQTAFILVNRPARIAIHAELMLPAA